MDRVAEAVKMFDEGYSCSQALVAVYGGDFGLERDLCLKVGSGFGGGVGCTGGMCGALTGAIMVIGLKYGTTDATDKEGKTNTYELVEKAIGMFESRTGFVNCRDLLGFDPGTAEGKESAKKAGSFDICPKLVKEAGEIIEDIL